jgi:acyl-CoA thioesterase
MAVGSLIDVRPVRGFPPFGRVDTTSLDWVRETSGRPVDRVQLALLADACAPRPFFWSEGPRPSATLAMTVYFHATDHELTAVGDDYVLNEVTGARGNASIADQSLRMWSRQGVLLASSHQLCSYR